MKIVTRRSRIPYPASCGEEFVEGNLQKPKSVKRYSASRKLANLHKGGLLTLNLDFPLNSFINMIIQAITDMANLPCNLVRNVLMEKHTRMPILVVIHRNNASTQHSNMFITFHQAICKTRNTIPENKIDKNTYLE